MSADVLYKRPLPLLTDLYQLTMAYGYWVSGRADLESVFHLYFRKLPFKGGFAVACGLGSVIDYLQSLRFEPDDLAYLSSLVGKDGNPIFPAEFINFLRNFRFACSVDAPPEGTIVFPNEPLLRVRGPLWQCQLLETPLLAIMNFQTLIATKAARICIAAQGDPVVEFGLRQGHGVDGSVAASRAAFVGGCMGTSNLLAGKALDIPVRGTHAHSWVMAFDTELEAFRTFARAMPNNCLFLVDTYNTLEGIKTAIDVGRELRAQGQDLLGIRLDSGDLAWLSIKARELLDAAGFDRTMIVASNDLDERLIASLKQQGARINMWGVGTRLVTAYDQPALGGVYKLSALRQANGSWNPKLKLSEQAVKTSLPGILQVRRFEQNGEFGGDMIYDELHPPQGEPVIIDPTDITRHKQLSAGAATDLLVPVFRGGELHYAVPSLDDSRTLAHQELKKFHAGIKRFDFPHEYPVGLDQGLHQRRYDLIVQSRNVKSA